MLRASIAIVVFAVLRGQAMADDARVADLNKLVRDWTSIAVPGTATTGPDQSSTPEHEHDAREVWYMRSQIRLALRLCNEGKTHEAMLRMDEASGGTTSRGSSAFVRGQAAVTCSNEEAES